MSKPKTSQTFAAAVTTAISLRQGPRPDAGGHYPANSFLPGEIDLNAAMASMARGEIRRYAEESLGQKTRPLWDYHPHMGL